MANIAFANAFVKVFLDSDDQRLLNRASATLGDAKMGASSDRRRLKYTKSEDREITYLRWTKSAINLHNNHVGRQVISMSTAKLYIIHIDTNHLT